MLWYLEKEKRSKCTDSLYWGFFLTWQNFREFGNWARALQQSKEWRRKKRRGSYLHHLSRTSSGLRPHCCRSLDSCYTPAWGGCRHWCCFFYRWSILGWCRPGTHSQPLITSPEQTVLLYMAKYFSSEHVSFTVKTLSEKSTQVPRLICLLF